MHATHFDPSRALTAAMAALALALVAALLISALGTLDLGSGSSQASVSSQTPPATWVSDPIASPLNALQAPVTATP
jgi:hypothetical protein